MAVQGLTRAEIRQHIGRNLMGAGYIISSVSSSNSDSKTTIDSSLIGGVDRYNGWWQLMTGAVATYENTGEVRRVDDTTLGAADVRLAVRPDFTNSVDSGDPYELWAPEYNPIFANDFINQAITSVTGRQYTKVESLALHGDGRTGVFSLPSTFDMVDRVLIRSSVEREELHSCDAAWDESVDSDFTITADTEHLKRGNSSCKFVIAGTVSDGDFSSDDISSKDLSAKTHIELWAYATTATAASDLALLLDNTASCASPVETIVFPALTARTWTFVRLALANPELDTAIISVGLEYNANSGANTIWLDDIQAVNEPSSVYTPIPSNLWRINQAQQELRFSLSAINTIGNNPLKIYGGTNPAQLTADLDVCKVDEDFVIAQATALMLRGGSNASANDPDGRRTNSDRWQLIADRARRRIAPLVGVRRAS